MNDFSILSPEQFENLTLDLMQELGLKNCVWRTPGRDVGRDIQGDFFESDFSGFTRRESWYIECKRYDSSVSWPIVWEKIAYADSNNADILLIVTSSFLSPQAIDEVNNWNDSRKKPIIRFWSGLDLLNKLNLFPHLLIKYCLSKNPVRDAAVSILPLTKILTKYSNLGLAHAEFNKGKERIDDVIHSMSEFLSAKIEEIETGCKISKKYFSALNDGFSWVDNNSAIEQMKIDRYVARALVCLVRCHQKEDIVTITWDEPVLTIGSNLLNNESFCYDLKSILFWAGVVIKMDPVANKIELYHECT